MPGVGVEGSPCRESKVMMGKLDIIAFIAITKDPGSDRKKRRPGPVCVRVSSRCTHTHTNTRAHAHTLTHTRARAHALAGAAPGGSRWHSVARRPRDLTLPSPAARPPPASGPQPAPGPCRAAALHLTEGEIMRSIRGAVTAPRQLLVHSNHRRALSYLRAIAAPPVPPCSALPSLVPS